MQIQRWCPFKMKGKQKPAGATLYEDQSFEPNFDPYKFLREPPFKKTYPHVVPVHNHLIIISDLDLRQMNTLKGTI